MAALRRSKLLLLPALAAASWAPRPLTDFHWGSAAPGSAAGVRRFRHHEAHLLEDGSDLLLQWEVDADPATIVSLDTEGEGVRVDSCRHDGLTLHVPRSYGGRLQQWRYVTASEHLHGCGHLRGEHLYYRVEHLEEVANHSSRQDLLVVRLGATGLPSPSHVFSHCKYRFSYLPARAKGAAAEALRGQRRLSTAFGSGNPTIENSFQPSGNSHKSLLNFDAPTQLGNIGYNWDYDANTTLNPQFKYTFPGGVGFARLYEPYLHAHFSLDIEFESHFKTINEPPHEVVTAELNGNGSFNLDLATAVNFKEEKSAGVLQDVLKLIKIPGLTAKSGSASEEGGSAGTTEENGEDGSAAFLNPIKFYFGGTPLTIKPGFSCQLKAYHIGLLKGSLRVGMASNLQMRGLMKFDSNIGVTTNVSGHADHIKFTAPTWMLFTEHFEMGMMLEPMFWIKGGFGKMRDMEIGFSVRPYFNVSIMQENPAQLGGGDSLTKELAIYPFRAVGLPTGKNYAIQVTANGQTQTTPTKFSTGVVEFNDDVESYDFGMITETALQTVPVEVAILEEGREVARGQALCSSQVNGICQPSPVTAELKVDGKTVYVHLTIVWSHNALSVLMSKIKSVALRFPTVTVSPAIAKELKSGSLAAAELRVMRNGRSYSVPLSSKENSTTLLKSRVIYDLGPCFLGSWKSAGISAADRAIQDLLTPKLELLVGGRVIGTGTMPPVSWDSAESSSSLSHLASNIKSQLKTIPVMVPLYPPGSGETPGSSNVGTGEIKIDVLPAQLAAFWVYPYQSETFIVGKKYTFYWTLVNGVEGKAVDFTLTAMEVGQSGTLTPTNWQQAVKVSCSQDGSVKLHRYDGGVAACLFAYEMLIPSALADKEIVVVASWLGDSLQNPHWMVSTPVRFASGRRLGSQWGAQSLGAVNHTGFGQGGGKAKEKLKKLASHCTPQNLLYSLNAGMNAVEHMKNVIIPVGGGLGSMGDRPDWTSKPIPVIKPLGSGSGGGGQLQDILPALLCSGGVCKGMMPGCNKTRTNPMEISKINVQLSRTFRWKEHFGPKMRHMIAYALALAPSAIQIGQQQAVPTDGGLQEGMARRLGAAASARPHIDLPGNLQHSRPVRVESGSFAAEQDDGLDHELGDSEFRSFVVEVRQPTYALSDEVLRSFLSRGAFKNLRDGREATHGPVEVLSLKLLQPASFSEKYEVLSDRWAASHVSPEKGMAVVGCFAGLLALLAMARITMRRRDYALVGHPGELGGSSDRLFA